jgi:hypothetical protein
LFRGIVTEKSKTPGISGTIIASLLPKILVPLDFGHNHGFIVTQNLGYPRFRAQSQLHCYPKSWFPLISGTIIAPLLPKILVPLGFGHNQCSIVSENLGPPRFWAQSLLHCFRKSWVPLGFGYNHTFIVTQNLGPPRFRAQSYLHCYPKSWSPSVLGTITAPLLPKN